MFKQTEEFMTQVKKYAEDFDNLEPFLKESVIQYLLTYLFNLSATDLSFNSASTILEVWCGITNKSCLDCISPRFYQENEKNVFIEKSIKHEINIIREKIIDFANNI